jgi:hypothetical protein
MRSRFRPISRLHLGLLCQPPFGKTGRNPNGQHDNIVSNRHIIVCKLKRVNLNGNVFVVPYRPITGIDASPKIPRDYRIFTLIEVSHLAVIVDTTLPDSAATHAIDPASLIRVILNCLLKLEQHACVALRIPRSGDAHLHEQFRYDLL